MWQSLGWRQEYRGGGLSQTARIKPVQLQMHGQCLLLLSVWDRPTPLSSIPDFATLSKNYLATEYTSFYWVPYPDGITCIVRDVRDFSDFIQLELTIKDQDMEKRVKDYYASCGQVTERSGFSEFSRKYFWLFVHDCGYSFAA